MEWHWAKVIDNNSLNSSDAIANGSVKIYIPDLMDGVSDSSLYPWAKPFHSSTGGSSEHGLSCIPEIDSFVWVWYEDPLFKKKPFYISDVQLKEMSAAELFDTEVKSSITGFSSNYPDVKFLHLKNGINIAVSSSDSTPEISIFHPTGSYIFMDSTGNISLKGATGSTVQPMILGTSFLTALSTFLSGLNPTTLATQASTFASAISAGLLQSQSVKNN